MWGWKDELPRKGLAWSGRRLRGGRASLLAPGLPVDCYRRVGERDDFRQAPFGGTRLAASAGEPASAFGWPRAAAGAVLEELVERGEAMGAGAHTGSRA